MSLLKNFISTEFIVEISEIIKNIIPYFEAKKFKKLILDKNWENRELKQRTHHIASVLRMFLDEKYPVAVKQLVKITKEIQQKIQEPGVEYMFLQDFIEDFGVDYFEDSIAAIEEVTKFFSCEFAVRPFYKKYPDEMMQQTIIWAKNPNYKVRRLASEGCRSKLPWATGVPFLKDNPKKIIHILDLLIDDKAEWVRLSVSNNLNDISKDYPDLVLDFAKKRINKSKITDKLLKHALRTLLKKGNIRALELFGYKYSPKIMLENFKIEHNKVRVGEDLEFEFTIKNIGKNNKKIRIEYVVYYQKASEILTPKIYQISETEITANSELNYERKRSFKPISTRKFHFGQHKIGIIVNGKELGLIEFDLV